MTNFTASAASRETSDEIMAAIYEVSGKNDAEAVRVWEEPRDEELTAIWEIVTKNGLIPSHHFTWGAAGGRWMPA